MPFVVCPIANVSPALQAEEAWWIPLTGARSGMKRSPMTRISLEVMIERGTGAFTASLLLLLCVESRQWSAVFRELRWKSPGPEACEFWAWHYTPPTFQRNKL